MNDHRSHTLLAGSVFLAIISAVLTIMNLSKGWWFMAGSTAILGAGFLVSTVFAQKKKDTVSAVIMAVLVAFIFSYYAITGENEGFACLWILLVPIIGLSLLGLRVGLALSLYYQLFLIVLFYTPLNEIVAGYYTETFLTRFPILYFATFGGVALLAIQRQYFLDKTVKQAYHDGLTNLFNRAYFMERVTSEIGNSATLLSFDINRLKYVNDNHGHDAGDELICAGAQALEDAFGAEGIVARIGGDEFAAITSIDGTTLDQRLDQLKHTTNSWKSRFGYDDYGLSISVGVASCREFPGFSADQLIKEADKRMYEDKSAWYKSSGFDRRK